MSGGEHTGTSQIWLKSVDRGGLTDITDETYQCLKLLSEDIYA